MVQGALHDVAASDGGWAEAQLSNADFRRLGRFIEQTTGILMPPARRTMLEARLRPRLRALGLSDFTAYLDRPLGPLPDEAERALMLDRATTNATEFFREAAHFTWLSQQVVPELLERPGGASRPVRLWSAGCSTGEEPYTMAMVLAESHALTPIGPVHIRATDISRTVLETAARAVYPVDRIGGIPRALRPRYLLRSRNPEHKVVRIVPALRRLVEFGRLNFMDAEYACAERFDVVFCRNVFIYFDRPTQEQVILRLGRCLADDGWLFLGHTDSLHGLDVPFRQVAPSVYRKSG